MLTQSRCWAEKQVPTAHLDPVFFETPRTDILYCTRILRRSLNCLYSTEG